MVGKSTGDYQLKCTLYQYYSTGIVTLLKWPWLSGTLLVDNHDCGSLKGFAVKSYYSMTIIIKKCSCGSFTNGNIAQNIFRFWKLTPCFF